MGRRGKEDEGGERLVRCAAEIQALEEGWRGNVKEHLRNKKQYEPRQEDEKAKLVQ